jgi:hypothetical protein
VAERKRLGPWVSLGEGVGPETNLLILDDLAYVTKDQAENQRAL